MRTACSMWKRVWLALLVLGCPASLLAAPIHYQFELTVGSINGFSNTFPYDGCDIPENHSKTVFPCKPDGLGGGTPVLLGDIFSGRFSVDADVSSLTDGAHLLPFSDFDVTVGMIRYSSPVGAAGCHSFSWIVAECWDGTRGYVGPNIGLGGSLAFVVTSGEITSLLGELHAPHDLPDLNFDAYRGAGNWIAYGRGDLAGTYTVHRVPEPSTVALLLLSVAVLGVWQGRLRPSIRLRVRPATGRSDLNLGGRLRSPTA